MSSTISMQAVTRKHIDVAVIGVGLVGSEFIRQLQGLPNRFRIVGLSSSRAALFSPSGLNASVEGWKADLAASTIQPSLEGLLLQLQSLLGAGRRVAVVDNTSAEDVSAFYPRFLSAGITIVTPNKKALSGALALYHAIRAAPAPCLYEATVGAGLPIVRTLQDLVETGDKVLKIEGVLSGTLSYIFNEFSTPAGGGPNFSAIVAQAREKGYTEPHPGDDLNGADVARKLTILSRLIPELAEALPEGYRSVDTKSLVPDDLTSVSSGDEFVKRLPAFDAEFDRLRSTAHAEGNVLRYVGVIDVAQLRIKASLEMYPATHAFATSLGGSDNIVAFHTERYGSRPLLVQGAGAGAAVTAMGVLSDLLRM